MSSTRRITVLIAVVGCGLIGFSGTAIASTPVSNFHVTLVRAGASFFNNQPPYDQANVFVTDTITVTSSGASTARTDIVQVGASWSTPDGFGNGCSTLANPGDFAFSSDLSTASLHTTLTQDLTPCNEFQPLVPDVTVDATWTGSGATAGGKNISRYACGGFTTEGVTTNSQRSADARFSFSSVSGGFEDTAANLGLSDQSGHAQGVLPDSCVPPAQKGFGIGPHPPGRYLLSSQEAGFDSADQTANLGVRITTFAANPNGAGSTTDVETDLFVNVNGSFGCFVLSPPSVASVSSDLSTASVHALLDQNTPQCGFGYFPFLPLSVDITMTGTGPMATDQSISPTGCFATFFLDKATHAGGNATLGFYQPDNTVIPVTYAAASSSEIDSSDHTFRMSGSTPCTPG